jgi:hypothetical protein
MANQNNPNLKFQQLSDAQVLELLNNKAIDEQWNVNNAKSPKGKRDAQEALNLFGSTIEMIKRMAHADGFMSTFRKEGE